MKGSKLLALALVLALCLGLAAPVLAAEPAATHEAFADLMVINPVTEDYQWKWAWPTIDESIRRGLFIGYTPYQDAQGNIITNFGPGDKVTEAVGLTLCARMMVDNDVREVILADRLDQMRELIPGTATNPDDPGAPFMWFREEAATCLELGVIEAKDLALMIDANRLGSAMNKADFAVYLVRAMGLEDFAKGLDAAELPFNDQADIRREYRPYVKLLTSYGVLTGDENQNFNPNSSMNRAVCATMLSRAIENIQEERQVAVELPRYTTYAWAEGYIQNVDIDTQGVRTLTLKSDITGTRSVVLPSSASIYQYNMPAKATDLKNGAFAKVCFNDAGEVIMVRLTPAGFLSAVSGDCDAISQNAVTVDGVTYSIDRFTEVSAGGKTGDQTMIDPEANYAGAKLVANSKKVVVSLELTGGTRLVDGILTDLTTTQGAVTKTTLTLSAFNGLPTTYEVPAQVTVTSGGQTLTGLKESFKGRHVTLRVADGDLSKLISVDVDIDSQYIQGVLHSVNTKQEPVRAEITRTGDAKRTPYEVDENCQAFYEGNATTPSKLPAGTFVTAKMEGGMLTTISAWTGLETTKGTLTGLTYGDPTVLVVTGEDGGAKSEFSIPLADLNGVTILVKGEDADITKLATGDSVEVTLHYHQVTQINVTPRSADVTGTLNAVTFNADGSALLSVRLADGTTVDYTAGPATTVTRSDKPVALTEIVNARGLTVSLVTEGDRALSIQFSGTATSQTSVEGVVYNKDDQARVISVLPAEAGAKPINVHVAAGVTVTDVNGTDLKNISRISVNDSVLVYGSYQADGVFEATLVLRK